MEHSSTPPGTGTHSRILTIVLSAGALILLIFITQILVRLQQDVSHLRDELATKEDLANLAVHIGPPDPAMAALEGTCTDCHTKETFAEAHGITEDVHNLVARMSELTGAHIAPTEIPKAEAALTFMKCAHCHSMDRLKELAILSPRERWDVIVKMMKEPGATISQDDAQRIRDFYGQFWGWHTK
ncbi:MAG: hypothetical protein OER21_02590 [Gemmatimonadota bacterium]|nr:hypothetical protein [Gemmatimonadota bacterium]